MEKIAVHIIRKKTCFKQIYVARRTTGKIFLVLQDDTKKIENSMT